MLEDLEGKNYQLKENEDKDCYDYNSRDYFKENYNCSKNEIILYRGFSLFL
ncbi:MAG: hypothetical protein GF316_08635 [Candidatus Lokiarchaeota archaeon]|nr:hypothetical protein [Candidatus Lokiarchaeota archaeon]